MSISFSLARRLAVGAVGASAVGGAMLFSALPATNTAAAPAPQSASNVGTAHVAPVFFGHHHHHSHGGIHIA